MIMCMSLYQHGVNEELLSCFYQSLLEFTIYLRKSARIYWATTDLRAGMIIMIGCCLVHEYILIYWHGVFSRNRTSTMSDVSKFDCIYVNYKVYLWIFVVLSLHVFQKYINVMQTTLYLTTAIFRMIF